MSEVKFNSPVTLMTGFEEIYIKGQNIAMTVANMMGHTFASAEGYVGITISDGIITAKFEGYSYGYWEETIELEADDFYIPYDELVSKYQKRREIADKKKAEAKKLLDEANRQQEEREFNRLKEKLNK